MKKRRSLVIAFVLLLALALTFTLAACDPKGQETPPTQYTVTFVGAGEAGADEAVKVNEGQKLNAAQIPAVPAKENYSNDGKWYVADAQDQPTDVEVNADYAINADIKAVPKYTRIQYGITFVGAGEEGADITIQVNSGAAIEAAQIPAVPAKEHYTNDGKWYVAGAEDAPTDVEIDAEYIVTGAVRAVPKYTQIKYTITFVGAGEQGADTVIEVNSGEIIDSDLIPAVPAKEHYSNDGKWYVAGAEDQPTEVAINEHTVIANVRAVPKYTQIMRNLKFKNAIGAGGQTEDVTVQVADGQTIATEAIPQAAASQDATKAFHYWTWDAPDEGKFDPNQPITKDGEFTAVYDLAFQVSYYCGTIPTDSQPAEGQDPAEPAKLFAGDIITLPANPYTRFGYTFNGWTIRSKAAGGEDFTNVEGQLNLQPEATFAIPAETAAGTAFQIVAQWEQQALHITFDPNGGTGEMAAIDNKNVGNSLGNIKCTFQAPAGKAFVGWAIKSNGVIGNAIDPLLFNAYKDGIVFEEGAYNLTLYAIWTRIIAIDDIKGVWTAAENADIIISDYMASDYIIGTALYNGELIALYIEGGIVYGSTATGDELSIAVAEDNSKLTINDVEYDQKAAINNSEISTFAGKWTRNNLNYYITEGSKAYRSSTASTLKAPSVQIIDKYIIIVTQAAGEYDMGYYLVLYKESEALKGWENKPETAPAAIELATGTFHVLSIEGEVNQLVNDNTAPNADTLNAAKHAPAGFEFEKWVTVDGDQDFDASTAMTADANIKAVYKPAGTTYNATAAVDQQIGAFSAQVRIDSFIISDDGKKIYITGEIAGASKEYLEVALEQHDNYYEGAKKLLLAHYYTFDIKAGLSSITMGIAIFKDGSATFCISSTDEERIGDNVYTRDGGNASFEADIKTFAKKEGVAFTASSYPVVLTSITFDVNLVQPVTKVTLTGKYNGGDLNVKEMELKVDANGKLFFDFQRFADDGATTKVELQLSDDKSSITLSTPTLTGDGVLPEGTLSPDEPDEPQEKDEYNFTGSLAIQNTSGVSKTLTKINIKTADKSGEGKYNTITVTLDGSDIVCNNWGNNFEASINANQCSVKVGTTWTKILYISFDIKAGTATIYDNSKAKIGEFKDESVAPAEPEQKSEYVFTGNYTLTVGANNYNITAIKVKTADLEAGKTNRYDKITLTYDGAEHELTSASIMDDATKGDYVKVTSSSSSVIYILINIEAGTATIYKGTSVVATFNVQA